MAQTLPLRFASALRPLVELEEQEFEQTKAKPNVLRRARPANLTTPAAQESQHDGLSATPRQACPSWTAPLETRAGVH